MKHGFVLTRFGAFLVGRGSLSLLMPARVASRLSNNISFKKKRKHFYEYFLECCERLGCDFLNEFLLCVFRPARFFGFFIEAIDDTEDGRAAS
jgi:hypothetical protein